MSHSGGGGGGQVREFFAQYLLLKGPFPVVVGTGGTAPAQTNTSGTTPGGDSSFNEITSIGGGQGAISPGGSFNVNAGLRGGGSFIYTSSSGSRTFTRNAAGTGGSSAYGRTSSGTDASGSVNFIEVVGGGGGGGAGSVTGNYIGGDGVISVITGLGYGGGGNAVQRSNLPMPPSSGTTGTDLYGTNSVFGAGGWTTSSGSSSYAPRENSGGGGFGRNSGLNVPGAPGAAGVVVIRYPTGALSATGGTTSTSGIYTLHTFTTSGTFTVL